MKIVIPLAGFGKRLRPHTFTKPKPLINVAEEYPHLRAHYYQQDELNGQSTAIYLAHERLHGPMLMVFVDTIIKTDLSALKDEPLDAVTWVKAVADPRRFGVAEVGENGLVTRLIEKPTEMHNNLAVVGSYYFKQSELLMDAIREQIERKIQTQNEYFLADAVNLMLQRGLKMRVQPVEVWQDCGKTETVLETNRYLLENGHDNSSTHASAVRADGYVIVPPVNIHPSAHIINSIIGPHATVAAGCQIENSIVRDSIVDEESVVQNSLLSGSLIGRSAKVAGRFRAFNVGEASEVGFE